MTREEAIKLIDTHTVCFYNEIDSPTLQALHLAIEALTERTGEWIFKKTDEYKRTYCSECGGSALFVCVPDDYYGKRVHGETRKTKFCPNCGTRMLNEVKKNDK